MYMGLCTHLDHLISVRGLDGYGAPVEGLKWSSQCANSIILIT